MFAPNLPEFREEPDFLAAALRAKEETEIWTYTHDDRTGGIHFRQKKVSLTELEEMQKSDTHEERVIITQNAHNCDVVIPTPMSISLMSGDEEHSLEHSVEPEHSHMQQPSAALNVFLSSINKAQGLNRSCRVTTRSGPNKQSRRYDYLPRDSDAEDELDDIRLLRGMPAATRPASPSN